MTDDIEKKILELPTVPLLMVYSRVIDDIVETKKRIITLHEQYRNDPSLNNGNSEIESAWETILSDVRSFLNLWNQCDSIFSKSEAIKAIESASEMESVSSRSNQKNGQTSTKQNANHHVNDNDNDDHDNDNDDENVNMKRLSRTEEVHHMQRQKKGNTPAKKNQKSGAASIDIQMSDIDDTESDEDRSNTSNTNQTLRSTRGTSQKKNGKSRKKNDSSTESKTNNTKDAKKDANSSKRKRSSKNGKCDDNNGNATDSDEKPPKRKRKLNNEEEQILYKKIVDTLFKKPQDQDTSGNNVGSACCIKDWELEDNEPVTTARSAVIQNPQVGSFCMFCKSIKFQNQCTTENCPGHSEHKIRKFTMTPSNMTKFKLFAMNETDSFNVNCGSQLSYNLKNTNPNVTNTSTQSDKNNDATISQKSQQKKAKCNCAQIVRRCSPLHPFLKMEPSHKDGCQFKTVHSESESTQQDQQQQQQEEEDEEEDDESEY